MEGERGDEARTAGPYHLPHCMVNCEVELGLRAWLLGLTGLREAGALSWSARRAVGGPTLASGYFPDEVVLEARCDDPIDGRKTVLAYEITMTIGRCLRPLDYLADWDPRSGQLAIGVYLRAQTDASLSRSLSARRWYQAQDDLRRAVVGLATRMLGQAKADCKAWSLEPVGQLSHQDQGVGWIDPANSAVYKLKVGTRARVASLEYLAFAKCREARLGMGRAVARLSVDMVGRYIGPRVFTRRGDGTLMQGVTAESTWRDQRERASLAGCDRRCGRCRATGKWLMDGHSDL
jgi:hypothetical protein